MIKIRFNKERLDDLTYHVKLSGRCLTIEAEREGDPHIYADRIPVLREYNVYSLVYAQGRSVMRFHNIPYQTNAIFYDLNAIGQPLRRHFDNALEMFNRNGVLANVTTGVFAQDWRPSGNRDIVIDILQGSKEKTTIEVDGEYETEEFCMSAVQKEGFPRDKIWDGYTLTIGDTGYMVNSHEAKIKNDFGFDGDIPGTIEYEGDSPITMKIEKFHGRYNPTAMMTRDIDNDEVLVETTAGLTDTHRVYLENGVGTFRFFPLGYEGKMHIKLGRRWYVVCNDYTFNIRKKKPEGETKA